MLTFQIGAPALRVPDSVHPSIYQSSPCHCSEKKMSRAEPRSRRDSKSRSSAPQPLIGINSGSHNSQYPQNMATATHHAQQRVTPPPIVTIPSANTTSFRHPGGRASDWRGVERERHPGYASQNGSGPRRWSQLPGWNSACCQIMPFPQPLLHAFRHPGRPPRNRQ